MPSSSLRISCLPESWDTVPSSSTNGLMSSRIHRAHHSLTGSHLCLGTVVTMNTMSFAKLARFSEKTSFNYPSHPSSSFDTLEDIEDTLEPTGKDHTEASEQMISPFSIICTGMDLIKLLANSAPVHRACCYVASKPSFHSSIPQCTTIFRLLAVMPQLPPDSETPAVICSTRSKFRLIVFMHDWVWVGDRLTACVHCFVLFHHLDHIYSIFTSTAKLTDR
ncbi:hypothetical protein V8E55_007118 [Tylopilus felleus]